MTDMMSISGIRLSSTSVPRRSWCAAMRRARFDRLMSASPSGLPPRSRRVSDGDVGEQGDPDRLAHPLRAASMPRGGLRRFALAGTSALRIASITWIRWSYSMSGSSSTDASLASGLSRFKDIASFDSVARSYASFTLGIVAIRCLSVGELESLLPDDHLESERRRRDPRARRARQVELEDRDAREHRGHQQERDQHREDVDHRHEQELGRLACSARGLPAHVRAPTAAPPARRRGGCEPSVGR